MRIDPGLLVAALLGEASDEELRQVGVWRAKSPENDEEYRRLARIWNLVGPLKPRAGVAPPAPEEISSKTDILSLPAPPAPEALIRARPEPPRSLAKKGLHPPGAGPLAATAAAFVMGLVIGIWAGLNGGGGDPTGTEVLVTGVDDVATLTLRDETVVHLAPRSRLVFSRGADAREVSLTGRAYLAVTPNPDHPFRVHLPGGEVEVLGTRFDVESRDDGLQVTVVDGNVRMETRGGHMNVRASQVARVSTTGVGEVRDVEDVYEIIDWLGRFLAFESTPLEEVAVELQRRFGIEIEITNVDLRRRTVTGWFADQAPEAMIAAICTVVEAQCSTRNGRVRMELSDMATIGEKTAARGEPAPSSPGRIDRWDVG